MLGGLLLPGHERACGEEVALEGGAGGLKFGDAEAELLGFAATQVALFLVADRAVLKMVLLKPVIFL